MKKTVLISGAAGFLGSHLTDYYLSRNMKVIGIDNFLTGSKRNIEHLNNNSDFTFLEHDIVSPLPKNIETQKIDIVLNMASPASPPHYQRLGIETLQVGSVGTLNMLEIANKNKARFFQASTSEVYGDPEIHPQPESYRGSVNCYGPRSMYDEAKRYAEALIFTYREKHKTNTCIGRFFNTYGPRMDAKDGRVVSNFIVQALQGKPLTVYGDGGQTRSFCYVDDLVEAIALLIDSDEHEPMNLGNDGEFTVKELAEIVQTKIGNNNELVYLPLPGDDPLQRKPVIKMAQSRLKWKPKISLEDGLDKTIDYFRTVV